MKSILKKIIVITSLIISTNLIALEMRVGSDVEPVPTELEVKRALRVGDAMINNFPIIISSGANVPSRLKQKWMANQLSGIDAPRVGEFNKNCIFIDSF